MNIILKAKLTDLIVNLIEIDTKAPKPRFSVLKTTKKGPKLQNATQSPYIF